MTLPPNDQANNNDYLLSICIPTYNRADILNTTLLSIIHQVGFDERCEIVISDNCSDDNTPDIIKYFQSKHNNIRYHRNEVNNGEANFITVMNMASGRFIKLHNDNKEFLKGSLKILLNVITEHDCSVAFTLHTPNPKRPLLITCNTFDDFVRNVSCQSTWLAGIMLLRDLYQGIDDKERAIGTNLVQTDIMFRILRKDRRSVVINEQLFYDHRPKYRGGYNFFNVHLNNYLALYEEYLADGLLTDRTFEEEKIKLLKMIIIPWYAKIVFLHKYYSFDLKGASKSIMKYYGRSYQLYLAPFYLIGSFLKKGNVRKLIETIS
jgi:glycosyltransferase involved in cell wall biosynthesis